MKQPAMHAFLRKLIIIISLFAFAFPFLWMLLASFKPQISILSNENIFKFTPSLNNYMKMFEQYDFIKYFVNSLIIAVGSTLGSLILGLPAAFAVARYQMHKMSLIILIAKIIPGITFLIPWFILFSQLKLVDTYTALILSHMLVSLPFIVWIMISFFESLPLEIEESSLIDGCTKVQTFRRIVLPISLPGIFTCSLLAFIYSWNNFMYSLILSGDKTKTLPVAVFNFISYTEIDWGGIMAAASIITLPVLIISLFFQRYVVSGLSAGAIKG